MMKITGLLLAAGKSTRFGRDKLIEPLADSSIAGQSAKNILPHVSSLAVVIAEHNIILAKQLEHLALTILPCSNADQGMATSLVFGIQHTLDCDGWLIALADMPFIQRDIYAQIISAAQQGHPLIAPYYQQKRGHPIFISKKFKEELLQLQGDVGARDILLKHADEIHPIQTGDASILRDIDFQRDLLK